MPWLHFSLFPVSFFSTSTLTTRDDCLDYPLVQLHLTYILLQNDGPFRR